MTAEEYKIFVRERYGYNFEKIVEEYKWYKVDPERGITIEGIKKYIEDWGTLELSKDFKLFRRVEHPKYLTNIYNFMIKVRDVRIPQNYVLVKPDEDHEKFQVNGRDTGIYAGTSKDSVGQRVAVTGTVVAVPLRLTYLQKEIEKINKDFSGDERDSRVGIVKQESVRYKVPVEIHKNDKVIFFYKNQFDCYHNGRVFYTDEGTMFLIKYDELFCVVHGVDNFYPLNGLIFLEPMELPKNIFEDTDLEQLPSGILKPTFTHEGFKKKGKIAMGMVTHIGCLCEGYLDFLDQSDKNSEKLVPGEIVFYHPNYANNLQFDLHQTLSEKKRLRLHRKDLFAIVKQTDGLDVNQVLSNFNFK
jgi:hypothetical protein